ncbi:MAG: diguanylate cyclase protein [Actinomycetia bacterium]|nr:diguanylate cyclase protein [Actinomycetes bacterium]
MDRRLIVSVCAAVGALAAGVCSAIFSSPELAVLAGLIGLVAGVAAAALGARLERADHSARRARGEVLRLRRELDELAAVVSEEAAHLGSGAAFLSEHERLAAGPSAVTTATAVAAESAFDTVTGLLDERFFAVLVQQRVAAARRQLQPVSVVLFELDGFGDAHESSRDSALGVLGDVMRSTLRECDTACRIGDTMAAAVLEDTTEAGAVWAAERVRGTLHGSPLGDSLTISAGVACYPSHALGAPELVAMAGRALDLARTRGRDHVEIAPGEG